MYYFAYASNLNKKQMQERCPDSKPMFIATLPNYKLVFVDWSRHWHGAVASIRPFRGERVRGAIYEISEQCLRRLDRYEGYPDVYTHLNVTVFNEDNEPVPAIAYIKSGRLEDAPPAKEYLAVIQQGYRDWRLF